MKLLDLSHVLSSRAALVGVTAAVLITALTTLGRTAYTLRRTTRQLRAQALVNDELDDMVRQLRDAQEAAHAQAVSGVMADALGERQALLREIHRTVVVPMQSLRDLIASSDSPLVDPVSANISSAAWIQYAVEALTQSAEDVLASHLAAPHTVVLEECVTDLRAVIDGAVALLAPAVAQKRVRLQVCIDRSVAACVLADRARVGQLVFNLLNYVIERADTGAVTLSARAESLNRGAQRVVIGLSGPLSAVDKTEGTIGTSPVAEEPDFDVHPALSLCRVLARRMGGDVTVMQGRSVGVCVAFHAPFTIECHEWSIADADRRCAIVDVARYEDRFALSEMLRKLGVTLLPSGTTPSGRIDYWFTDKSHTVSDRHDTTRIINVTCDPIAGGLRRTQHCDELSINPLSWSALQRLCTMRGNKRHAEPPRSHARRVDDPHPHKILIVDDNEFNLKVLARQLDLLGYRHVMATSAAEALVVLASEPVDMLITDLQMPRMSGIELAERVRAVQAYAVNSMPIVLMTAHALPHASADSETRLFDAFLVKAPDIDALSACLRQCLRRHMPAQGKSRPARLETFDFTQLDTLSEQGVDLDALLRDWRETMDKDLAGLHACHDAHDVDGLRAMLHRLGGAVALVGDRGLMEVLEHASTKEPPPDTTLIQALTARVQTFTVQLTDAVKLRERDNPPSK